jgi:hypothetical protein
MKFCSKSRFWFAFFFVLAAACKQSARSESIPVFGTGVAADGSLLSSGSADSHYQLISYPGQIGSAIASAYAFDSLPFGYLPNGPASKWISPSLPFGDSPGGRYIYRTTFDLSGFNPLTATIQGQIASDNEARIFLNGVDTGVTTPNIGYSSFVQFAFTTGFISGLNTIDIQVHNDSFVSFNPTALRLDLGGSATAVPEPSTFAMLAIALPAIAGAIRCQRRRVSFKIHHSADLISAP